jgi:FKBP-type peptidyl-prolyl cis-trans isomerase
MNNPVAILYIIISVLISSCVESKVPQDVSGLSSDRLVEINKELIIKDRERIINYIRRKDLDMKETETGLWYKVTNKGSGTVGPGNKVSLDYELSLLDGTICYTSESDGALSFTVDRSDIPAGLNEGVKMLGEGGKALLIVPSYLGFGMVGDEKRIPARAVLVYELRVTSLR